MQFENLSHIIQAATSGNVGAQRAMYEKYKGFCLKLIFRYVFNYEKAVDVMHDGFIKVFRSLHSFRQVEGPESDWLFIAWMKRIMINTAIDELKKTKREPDVNEISPDIWEIPDNNEKSDKLILYKDMIMIISSLPADYRIVFNMFMIDGIDQQEIAVLLGIPLNTVKSKILRSKAMLRKIIQLDYSSYV